MKEIFKDIAGYEGLYQVSNLGRVKSLKYGKERILKPKNNPNGYSTVLLWKKRTYKSFLIHRLVAAAFLQNPNNFSIVNHINQDKKDNRVSNLEWCNHTYNIRYSWAKKVGCFRNGKLIKIYDAIQDAMKDGFHISGICKCCKGKLEFHKGFQWKYLS